MGAAAAGIGITAVGSAVGAYGSYQEGQQQSAYYQYLQENSRKESALVGQQAEADKQLINTQASQESLATTKRGAEVTGAQGAAEGASGVTGVTAANISNDTYNKIKLDQMAIKYNADVAQYKTEQEAKLKQYELATKAGEYGAAAKGARNAGNFGAFNSILSGATSVSKLFMGGSSLSKG